GAVAGAGIAGVGGFAALAAASLARVKDQQKKIKEASEEVGQARTGRAEAAASLAAATTEASQASARQELAVATRQLNRAERHRQALVDAMTPAQKRAADAMTRLKSAWHGFLADNSRPILGALVQGMGALERVLPAVGAFIRPVSRSLGAMFDIIGDAAGTKQFRQFARTLGDFSAGILAKGTGMVLNLARGFGALFTAFMPLGTDMSDGLLRLTKRFSEWASTVGRSKGFRSFVDYVRATGPVLMSTLGSVFSALISVGKALAPMAAGMLRAVGVFAKWLARTAEAHPMLIRIVAGFALLTAGVSAIARPLSAVVGVFRLLFAGVAGGIKILKIVIFNLRVLFFVLRASPIGMVITAIGLLVAGLVIAYKKSDTFRRIVDRAWDAIKRAVSAAWNRWIKPALQAMGRFFTDTLMPIIRRLWNNVVKPVFAAVGRAIRFAWANIIKPVFKALWSFLRDVLFPVIRFLWNNVVKPIFKLIGAGIRAWWNNIVKPVFAALKWFFGNVLFPVFRFLWNKVVKPVFNWIGDKIAAAWKRVRPILQALGTFIRETVAPAFRRGVSAIGNAWDNIKRLAMVPVNFVINTVYNNGIRKFVNGVLDKLGSEMRLPYVQPVGAKMSGGSSGRTAPGLQERMAAGGVLPGFTPRRDVHTFVSTTGGRLDLSGGEAFMVPEWTRAVGGPKEVARQNKLARAGRFHHALPGPARAFAAGGTMPVPGSGNQHTSGYPWATWAGDFPIPLGTPVKAYREGRVAFTKQMNTSYGNHIGLNHPGGISTLYAHLSRILVGAGQAVRQAQVIGRSGSTGNSTGPHVHLEIQGAPFGPGGDQGGGGFMSALVRRAVSWLGDRAKSLLGRVPGQDTIFGSAAVGAGRKVVAGIEDFIIDKFGDTTAGVTGNATPVNANARLGRRMLQARGWGRFWSELNALVMGESGWRNTAQNPTSSAYGIGQFLDSTWATVGARKTSNAAAQIRAMFDYIAQRYVNPARAWAFKQANNWYDNGGFLPKGLSLAMNNTGSRERMAVFTNEQWRTLKRAITGLTMNQGRPITAGWLARLLDDVPKSAARLREEFLRTRDAMRAFRTRTERARRTLERIQASDRFERRAEEAGRARRAFRATRSGEAIREDIAQTRREASRAARRARRSPMARESLREFRIAQRRLEQQRSTAQVEAAHERTQWRLRKAREDDDSRGVERAQRRLKVLREEQDTIDRLTRQRRRAGSVDAVRDLARARGNLDKLREERQERQRLRREMRRAGKADILQREEKAQQRLNDRIRAEKDARDRANRAAQAYRAAQEAARERARSIFGAGVELGGIGAASFKTSGGILSNLRRAVRTVREWGGVTRALIGAGLRGPILDEFIDAGPSVDAVRTGKSLLAGGQIGEVNRLQEQLRTASIRAGAIGARSYTPTQRAAIRRTTPVRYTPAAGNKMREDHYHLHGMPADTMETLVNKVAARVEYTQQRQGVV
ncbi:MAG: peptidoglycan DD-metalloendopeptidase family protein, partial [Stackebrandtia sp.]